MATISQVNELLKAGHSLVQIREELHIPPSRLNQMLQSKRMKEQEVYEKDSIPILARKRLLGTAFPSFDRLGQLAGQDNEVARKACVDLLEQLNLNFPPGYKKMRSSFWDR